MQAQPTEIDEVVLITPKRHGDARGYFAETFRDDWFRKNVDDITFVQDNHSLSAQPGTLRGVHYQAPPYAQAKLVRCVAGAIWDVAVDVRRESPTYGQWTARELTAENGHQLYVPAGFAHGFLTLLPDTEITYKCSNYYHAESDAGFAWNDPDIAVPWPLPGAAPILSAKDQTLPNLRDIESPFAYRP